MRKMILMIILGFVVVSVQCKKDSPTNPPMLALRSVQDTIAYSFTAESYSFYEDRVVLFTKDTVLAKVAVTGYGSGTATFTLYNSSHSAIIAIPLTGITAQDLTVVGRPGYCSIGFDRWTGAASVLVTSK